MLVTLHREVWPNVWQALENNCYWRNPTKETLLLAFYCPWILCTSNKQKKNSWNVWMEGKNLATFSVGASQSTTKQYMNTIVEKINTSVPWQYCSMTVIRNVLGPHQILEINNNTNNDKEFHLLSWRYCYIQNSHTLGLFGGMICQSFTCSFTKIIVW